MEEVPQSLKYATIKNQLIQAIIGEHFRFASETQAKTKLKLLEQQFIRSKKRPDNIPPEQVFLWIKDFKVTPQEKSQGYKGNFAAIYYKEVKSLRGG